MPGNLSKKRSKKSSNRLSALDRLRISRHAKAAEQVTQEVLLARMKSQLPYGHEVNTYKVESTFGPIERMIDAIESEGDIEVDERGEPIIWNEDHTDSFYISQSLQNLPRVFALLGKELNWQDRQPEGLQRVGAKLNAGVMLFQSDIDDARTCLAWMRQRIAEVTPAQWLEALNQIEKEEEGKEEACRS